MKENPNSARQKFFNFLLWPLKSFLRLMAVIAIFGLYQYQSFRIDMVATDVRTLELHKSELENKSATLQADVDQLTNINRIEIQAREQFGLISSGNDVQQLVIEAWQPKQENVETNERSVSLAGVQ